MCYCYLPFMFVGTGAYFMLGLAYDEHFDDNVRADVAHRETFQF